MTASMLKDKEAMRYCCAMGGNIKVPRNEVEFNKLGNDLAKSPKFSTSFWVPIFKQTNDVWLDSEQRIVKFLRWRPSQPNGGDRFEKCAAFSKVRTVERGYFDTGCHEQKVFYCEVNRVTIFTFKGSGLCGRGHVLDSQYVLDSKSTHENRPVLTGFTSSQIIFNSSSNIWQIENRFSGIILARLEEKSVHPFGALKWRLEPILKCGALTTMMLR